MNSRSATQNKYPYQTESAWSRSEKVIARTAFDAALRRELHEVMQEAKHMANQINDPADVWNLEHFLSQRRKEIDRKYHFRSSCLTLVLGKLLSQHRITEEELHALREDKRKAIRSCAKVLSEETAGQGF